MPVQHIEKAAHERVGDVEFRRIDLQRLRAGAGTELVSSEDHQKPDYGLKRV